MKYTQFHTLETQVNQLDIKVLDAATLIQINQYNRDKPKIGDVDKKHQTLVVYILLLFLKQKWVKLRTNYYLLVIYSRKQTMAQKYQKSREIILLLPIILNLQVTNLMQRQNWNN